MFDFINPFELLLQLELSKYLFGSLFVFGTFILLRLLIFKKGI